jgi:uncharacterized membrane protein YgcG
LVLELRRALAVLAADRFVVPAAAGMQPGALPAQSAATAGGAVRASSCACASSLRRTLAPRALHSALPPPFNSFAQQDAAEVVRFLLDAVESAEVAARGGGGPGARRRHQEAGEAAGEKAEVEVEEAEEKGGEVKESGSVAALFGGLLETRTVCLVCGAESVRREAFTDLALPLPDSPRNGVAGKNGGWSVPQLVSNWLQPERMEGDNAYACEACAEQHAVAYDAELKAAVAAAEAEAAVAAAAAEAAAAVTPESAVAAAPVESASLAEAAAATAPLVSAPSPPPSLPPQQPQPPPCQPPRSPAERRTVLVRAPMHLVVSLGRFAYDPILGQRTKRLDAVRFYATLNLPLGDGRGDCEGGGDEGCEGGGREEGGAGKDGGDGAADGAVTGAAASRKRGLAGEADAVSVAATAPPPPKPPPPPPASSSVAPPLSVFLPDNPPAHLSGRPPPRRRSPSWQTHPPSVARYVLYGVVVHGGGSAQAGHYYALVRDSEAAAQAHAYEAAHVAEAAASGRRSSRSGDGDGRSRGDSSFDSGGSFDGGGAPWHLFNDASVSVGSPDTLARLAAAPHGASDTPYLLFYRRVDHVLSLFEASWHPAATAPGPAATTTAVRLAADLSAFLARDNAAALREAARRTHVAPAASVRPPPPPAPPRGGPGGGASGFGFGPSGFGGGFGGMGGGGPIF